GSVAAFEQDDDPLARLFDPVLQPAKLHLQLLQLLFVNLSLHLAVRVAGSRVSFAHDRAVALFQHRHILLPRGYALDFRKGRVTSERPFPQSLRPRCSLSKTSSDVDLHSNRSIQREVRHRMEPAALISINVPLRR